MRLLAMVLAGSVLVGLTGSAPAAPKWMRSDGQAAARESYPGKSYYAPGQVKKRLGVKSARDLAPGHNAAVTEYEVRPARGVRIDVDMTPIQRRIPATQPATQRVYRPIQPAR
jgi:hypothetical protein